MKVRDLMTPNPKCAEPDTTVEEIATMMKEEDIGCVPVVDDDGQVAGVITDRDIVLRCIAEGKDPSECRADDVISPQSVCISPDADAKEAASLMADRQIRRLAVVENDRLVGMLSLGDVAVKQQDDRLSGDVLQDVSEGVKSSSGAANMSPHQGSSHADRRHGREEDARLSSRFEPGPGEPSGITNRGREEAMRQEKVLPFRERQDNRIRAEANRTREAAEHRKSAEGNDRKKVS